MLHSSAVVLALVAVSIVLASSEIVCRNDTSTGLLATGLCACDEGWDGPSCGICTSDTACRSVLADTGAKCATNTFVPRKKLTGWCGVDPEDVRAVMSERAYVYIGMTSDSKFYFELFKEKASEPHSFVSLFRCNSSAVQITAVPPSGESGSIAPTFSFGQSNSTGTVHYVVPDLRCNVTCTLGADRSCTPMLRQVISNVGKKGDASVVCTPENSSCVVHESMLNMLGHDGVHTRDCLTGECVTTLQQQQ